MKRNENNELFLPKTAQSKNNSNHRKGKCMYPIIIMSYNQSIIELDEIENELGLK